MDFNPTVTIVPELDISRFSSYKIKATAVPEEGTLQDLKLSVTGINGDGGVCWDFYANGVCDSSSREYDMTYDAGNSEWTSPNIYPDAIYPEVYFASSAVTWNNAPLSTSVRRGEYQLMHVSNPFSMVGDMSLWIELNAVPNAANSANLEVYLVESGKAITDFNSDWRGSASVELVGTLSNTAVFNHTHHVVNSSHHLIPLATNSNGTVGSKSLNITGDFWIILYNTSPNVARGWNLRYQPSSLCNNNSRWYSGNQSGWSTALKSGCPDTHIHIARRTTKMDGVNAVLTGYYPNSEVYSKEQDFFFGDLPNLAPTGSLFLMPTTNGTYKNDLTITWDPASDPNGSPVKYTINLINANGSLNKNLITATSNTSYTWNTTGVVDGEYSLAGEVCDDGAPLPGDPLCTPFAMASNFFVDNVDPISSLSAISVTSTNDDNIAKEGETISLTFTSTGNIDPASVNFYSGGYEVQGVVTVTQESANNWIASFVVNALDHSGRLDFHINGTNLDMQYISTTDSSYVDIDTTPPELPVASPVAGTYTTTKSVTLSSVGSSSIRYSLDGTEPSCVDGTLYESAISVSSDTTIKAIGCDVAGNSSSVATLAYVIDTTPPELPVASPVAGTYTATKSVTLSSVGSSSIRYSLDGTEPSCVDGTLYESAISVSSDTTIKAIGCDVAGNSSSVATFAYVIDTTPPVDEEEDTPSYFEQLINKIVRNKDEEEEENEEEIIIPNESEKGEIYTTTISLINGIKHFSQIKVLVLDSRNLPIQNLEVALYSEPMVSSTNSEGIAIFNNVPVGSHTLRAYYNGQSLEKTIELADPGEETSVELEIIKLKVEDLEDKGTSAWWYIIPAILLFILLLLLYLKKKIKYQESF